MEAVNQLQLGGPTIYRQVAPSLLVAVPYLPLAFAAGASIMYYSLTWGRANEGAEEHLLDVFIQESDILAGLELEDGENELTPAHLEALLPDPPLLLLAVPLVEAMVWTGVAAERLARLGFKLDQRLGAELALAFVWIYAFVAETVTRSRLPPYRHLVVFLLLLTNSLVTFFDALHAYIREGTEILDLVSSIPDVLACAALVLSIIRMPLRAPLGSVLRDCSRTDKIQGEADRPQSPEDDNTLLGSLTYSWMNPIMSLARRRPLKPADVWSLSLNNRSEVLALRWSKLRESTLVGKILHASARDIAIDFSLKLVAVSLNYLRPYWIQRILECLTLASSAESSPWSPRDQAFIYALFAFLSMASRSLTELQHFHHARRIGMRLRAELTVAVYEKALKRKALTGEAADQQGKETGEGSASVGKVVSLISDDTNRVLRMGCDSHLIYGAPLEIILALGFLWNLMGWSSIAGFTILVLQVPLSYKLGRRSVELSRQRSAARDRRQASFQELIAAIRTVKFFGWSEAWTGKVAAKRNEELRWMVREWLNQFAVMALYMLISVVVPLLSFACYTKLQGEDLTVAVAFTALSYFSLVRGPLNQIPDFAVRVLQTKVSIARIESFFGEEEIAPHATRVWRSQVSTRLAFEKATLHYTGAGDDAFAMRNVSICFPEGKLTLVSGPTGSGKTSLLLALLGELELVSGIVSLPPAVSYAAQHPWLESASIRDAIIFGSSYDPPRYRATLDACALLPDLAMFPAGDATLVGERGVSLSGGQRARIALARAIYAPTPVVLLDDVLSAVDSNTGRHIFANVLLGPLASGRTIVLCSHHVHLVLPGVAYHVELEDGRVVSQRSVEATELDVEELDKVGEACDGDVLLKEEGELNPSKITTREKPSLAPETWRTGSVHRSIYATYLSSSSYLLWGAHLLFIIARPAVSFLEQFWLRRWGEAANTSTGAKTYFLVGFGVISMASLIVFLLSMALLFTASLRATRNIFNTLLRTVVRAPPRFFDITPIGRITNRFTNDVSILDGELAANFSTFAGNVLSMAASLGVTSWLLPSAILPTALFAFMYTLMFRRYLRVSRDLNRIAATTASPLFSGFQTVLAGLTTIRAFGRESAYRRQVCQVLDSSLSVWYCSCTLDVWLSIRTQLLSGVTLLFTSLFAIYKELSPGLAGIAISSSLFIIQYLDTLCSSYGRLVNSLNSLERITEYLELPQEPTGGARPPAAWPTSTGAGPLIQVTDLTIRYAPELEPSLRGVTFSVNAGERLAIAGRTGSGKSTLAMSLLRFVDPSQGSIIIDGLDVTSISLQDLRSRVTFLPQDAVIFSGLLRENLDPFNEHSDEELVRALQRTHLLPTSIGGSGASTPTGLLQTPKVSLLDAEPKLSAGQKQLVSLARALLRDSRILILDESTASLDAGLDAKIQATIREEFSNATLITIAHRLRTIVDYSRVLVIDAGRVVEFDTPKALLQKEGAFHSMCRESGDYEELLELAGACRDSPVV